MSHTKTLTRAQDYIYDPLYTVSSFRDHVSAIAHANTSTSQAAPVFANMFSSSPNYPSMSFQPKVASNINPSALQAAQSRTTHFEAPQVAGKNRFKYFRKPILQAGHGGTNYVTTTEGRFAAPSNMMGALAHATETEAKSPVREMGSQTQYRDSYAQTNPYSPEYTLPEGKKPSDAPSTLPELLALATLSFEYGLPAGLPELEMIERARQKRQWEATLPLVVPGDTAAWEKRLAMMEEREVLEWEYREQEIQRVQEARLEIISANVKASDVEKQKLNAHKVDQFWQTKMKEKEAFDAKLEQKRLKLLRKLQEKRRNVSPKRFQRDIIAEHANHASQVLDVHAPLVREGITNADSVEIEVPKMLKTYDGLSSLYNSLPRDHTVASENIPQHLEDFSSSAILEAKLALQLEQMHNRLTQRKQRAMDLSQKGSDGLEQEALDQLRFFKRKPQAKTRPLTPEITAPSAEEMQKRQAALLLQRLLRGRVEQNAMYQGRLRRQELIRELCLRQAISGEKTLDVNEVRELSGAESFEGSVHAPYIGQTLDFLAKELVRLREERRMAALVKVAERTRRMREAEESGHRQQELNRRKIEDSVFRQVMSVHHATVDSYLDSILVTETENQAAKAARTEVNQYIASINAVVEESLTLDQQEDVISNLVSGFLLPEAERGTLRQKVRLEEQKYVLAAHNALYDAVATQVEPTSALTHNKDLVEKEREALRSADARDALRRKEAGLL